MFFSQVSALAGGLAEVAGTTTSSNIENLNEQKIDFSSVEQVQASRACLNVQHIHLHESIKSQQKCWHW